MYRDDVIKSILINQVYTVKSSITNLLYINENRATYIFFNENEANRYIKENKNVILEEKKFLNPEEFMSECYKQGIHSIILVENKKEKAIHLNSRNVKRAFYNSTLNSAISLFKETQDTKYLKTIASCWFIVPIRINFQLTQEIVYGTAHFKTNEYKYLAFSDLEEYEKWAENAVGWKPLLVNFDVMCQISKECGYIVNIKGNSLMFPSKIMEKYRKYSSITDPAL